MINMVGTLFMTSWLLHNILMNEYLFFIYLKNIVFYVIFVVKNSVGLI